MGVTISLEELLEAGAHFGHQARRWNPKMAPYLYGVQEGVHIFDLTKTKEELERALEFLSQAQKEGKVVLFVGSKKQGREKTKEVAEAVGAPYINERWLGGTITNFNAIKKSIDKLADMKEKMAAGEYKDKYTKKEILLLDREIARLERFFGGMATLTKIPDALFVLDTKKESGAVFEAKKKGITVVGIVDSNADPEEVDYPIPMNDDATKAISYVLDLVKETMLTAPKVKVKKEETKK
ncbi:30S ribosomal protein S2 [Candidatus Woesebacteria bacterium]|nr:30S ribosomal protein S2 [Candidatus Woesebacteria bacterium]